MPTSSSARIVTALSKTHAGQKDWFSLSDEGISINIIKIMWKAYMAHTIETRDIADIYIPAYTASSVSGRGGKNLSTSSRD